MDLRFLWDYAVTLSARIFPDLVVTCVCYCLEFFLSAMIPQCLLIFLNVCYYLMYTPHPSWLPLEGELSAQLTERVPAFPLRGRCRLRRRMRCRGGRGMPLPYLVRCIAHRCGIDRTRPGSSRGRPLQSHHRSRTRRDRPCGRSAPKAPLCKGRDALRKHAGGMFLANAGSNL